MSTRPRRRTDRILHEWRQSRAAQGQAIFAGPAVDDVFLTPEGQSLPLVVLLRKACEEDGLGLVLYSLQSAPEQLPRDWAALPRIRVDADPHEALTSLVEAMRAAEKPGVLILDFADLSFPASVSLDGPVAPAVKAVQQLATDAGWRAGGLSLVLIDRGGGLLGRVSSISGMHHITLDTPGRDEIRTFIERRQVSQRTTPLTLHRDLTAEHAAALAGGLLLEDVHGMALCSSPTDPVTAERLADLKGSVLERQSHGHLEVMRDGADMTDVAGMEHVKLLLRRLLACGRTNEQFVLVGPPGTGKTYCAQALAKALGIPLVALRGIMGEGLLGQAERNAELVATLLRALAPVGLFADEVDQGPLRARSASGQTSSEAYLALRATLLNLLSDAHNGISVIATSNIGSHLDPATVSRMRFLPVLFATAPELAQIVAVQARRSRIPLMGDPTKLFEAYLETGRVLDGRSTQRILDKALMLAHENGSDQVTPIHLEHALRRKLGNDLTDGALYSTLDALLMADDGDSLPWRAAEILGQPVHVPRYLRDYVHDNGELDVDRARATMTDLRSRGVYA